MTITFIQRNQDLPFKRVTGYMSGTYTAASVTNALLTTTNADANGFQIPGAYSNGVLGSAVTLKQNVVLGSGVCTITLGFQPKHVLVKNITDSLSKEWFEGMNVTDSELTVLNGTRSLVTSSGVLISSPSTGGTAPVTTEPVATVTITFATDSLVADNKTWIYVIEG